MLPASKTEVMHDTAFQIGSLALSIYTDLPSAAVLEVGAQSFNGSLRSSVASTTEYVGLDIEQGEGVDLVIEPGQPFPVETDHFDLVMATSVFEHDPMFWRTFLEMCRAAKDGGYIYINAPSNGVVHRYPQDIWRFYPDAGRALADWAVSQGQPVSLVESFIADRQADIWNDFVAVFRKGRVQRPLPKTLLHENFPSANVITWKSSETVNPRDLTQDMMLIAEANERASGAIADLESAKATISSLSEKEAEAAALAAQVAQLAEQAEQQRSEIDGLRTQLDRSASHVETLSAELAVSKKQALMNAEMLARTDALLAQSKEMHAREQERAADMLAQEQERAREMQAREADRAKRIEAELSARLARMAEEVRDAENRLREHFEETARLSQFLLDRDTLLQSQSSRFERLQRIERVLSSEPGWWGLLPVSRRQVLRADRLKKRGLFDAQSYLRCNPDVAAEGFDPLEHYLLHGLAEDRRF